MYRDAGIQKGYARAVYSVVMRENKHAREVKGMNIYNLGEYACVFA